MTEKKHQSNIIKKLESEGWYVIKLIKTNKNGIPDIIAIKSGDVQLIEVKGSKGKLSELQKYRIKELNELKIKTHVSYAPD